MLFVTTQISASTATRRTESRTTPPAMSTVRQARPKAPLPLYLDDVVVLRKPHPCGGDTWRVVRLGADIGLVCTTCARRVPPGLARSALRDAGLLA